MAEYYTQLQAMRDRINAASAPVEKSRMSLFRAASETYSEDSATRRCIKFVNMLDGQLARETQVARFLSWEHQQNVVPTRRLVYMMRVLNNAMSTDRDTLKTVVSTPSLIASCP